MSKAGFPVHPIEEMTIEKLGNQGFDFGQYIASPCEVEEPEEEH